MYLGIAIFILLILIAVLAFGSAKIECPIYIKSLCRAKREDKVLALSFDDGPNPDYTPKVLDLLKAHNIQATFFLIGKNAEQYPDLVRRIVSEGHNIGIHTYSHQVSFTYSSKAKVKEELVQAMNTLEQITGLRTRLFRPPFGVTNPNIGAAIRDLNLYSIGWSIRSFDTKGEKEKAFHRVCERLGNGKVILLHDNLAQAEELLKLIIEEAKHKGYEFLTIENLFEIDIYEKL